MHCPAIIIIGLALTHATNAVSPLPIPKLTYCKLRIGFGEPNRLMCDYATYPPPQLGAAPGSGTIGTELFPIRKKLLFPQCQVAVVPAEHGLRGQGVPVRPAGLKNVSESLGTHSAGQSSLGTHGAGRSGLETGNVPCPPLVRAEGPRQLHQALGKAVLRTKRDTGSLGKMGVFGFAPRNLGVCFVSETGLITQAQAGIGSAMGKHPGYRLELIHPQAPVGLLEARSGTPQGHPKFPLLFLLLLSGILTRTEASILASLGGLSFLPINLIQDQIGEILLNSFLKYLFFWGWTQSAEQDTSSWGLGTFWSFLGGTLLLFVLLFVLFVSLVWVTRRVTKAIFGPEVAITQTVSVNLSASGLFKNLRAFLETSDSQDKQKS